MDTNINYILVVYVLIFFMLCMIALTLPKYNATWYFAPNMSLLLSFSILHAMVDFLKMQTLNNPDSTWLIWFACLVSLASYLPLLEIARRTGNNIFCSVQQSAPWVFGAVSLVSLVLLPLTSSASSIAGLEKAASPFVSTLAALLSGIVLFTNKRRKGERYIISHNVIWMLILASVFICYSLSSSFLLLTNPPLTTWLPLKEYFPHLFSFSVQSLSPVCNVLACLGLLLLVLLAGGNCQIDSISFEWSEKPIVITDSNNCILRVNNAFVEYHGYTSKDAVGHKISLLNSEHYNDGFYVAMSESVKRTGTWQGDILTRLKNGEIYPSWLTITEVKDISGAIIYYVYMYIDITERKAREENIKRQAFYDSLTQLPNRLLLYERLNHSLDMGQRSGQTLALLMLDLDRFKSVNDSLGHKAGDELLQQVALRITTRLRDTDMVARLGGDEFIVLLEDITNLQNVSRVAEDIISDLSKPYILNQSSEVWIGASIGISLSRVHGDSPELLMDHADKALYQAKDQGRGCFAFFSQSLTIVARERIELETRLRKAIPNEELLVYYQPQIDIASGLIIGAEALVRWQSPTEGLILPSVFISVAEEANLIVDIGEWVLRETCSQGWYWWVLGLPRITLAVNVSPHQLSRIDISALVTKILTETGFSANQLELEITESAIMENRHKATQILNNLRNQGIRLAIDDFGTGYSSLAYLKSFPLNVLKIDKSFIDDIPHSKDSMEIAAAIIAMGHNLGLKVLAEGVETPEQLAFLRNHNCDSYQGFIASKPLPSKEFTELLRIQQQKQYKKVGSTSKCNPSAHAASCNVSAKNTV